MRTIDRSSHRSRDAHRQATTALVAAVLATGVGTATATADPTPPPSPSATTVHCHAFTPNSDLHNCDLSGADLHGADLERAEFSNADLTRANLSDTGWKINFLTVFRGATWPDGHKCKFPSQGKCD